MLTRSQNSAPQEAWKDTNPHATRAPGVAYVEHRPARGTGRPAHSRAVHRIRRVCESRSIVRPAYHARLCMLKAPALHLYCPAMFTLRTSPCVLLYGDLPSLALYPVAPRQMPMES
jgi:hypothetical protein